MRSIREDPTPTETPTSKSTASLRRLAIAYAAGTECARAFRAAGFIAAADTIDEVLLSVGLQLQNPHDQLIRTEQVDDTETPLKKGPPR